MTRTESVIASVRRIMMDAHFCHLVTFDAAGDLQSRLVEPFGPEDDLTIRVATDRHTRKMSELERDSRCLLVYSDKEGQGYVTVKGRTRIRQEIGERTKRWKEEWRSFYPEGPAGPHYVLLEIRPYQIEVMSFSEKIAADPSVWRPAILTWQDPDWILEEKMLPAHTGTEPGAEETSIHPEAAVKEVIAEYDRVLNAGDACALAALFTVDALMLPLSEPPIRGREQIRNRHERLFREAGLKHRLELSEVSVAHGWAVVNGRYDMELRPKSDGPKKRQEGSFLTFLERTPSGKWRIARDIWN